MIPIWDKRPVTVANLLNPAFCGEIIRRSSLSYQSANTDKNSLPFQLAFLVLPFVLHKYIRNELPKKSNKNLIMWIEENQKIKMEIPSLIKRIVPFTKEAIMFLMTYEVANINDLGQIEIIKKSPKLKIEDSEVLECYNKAELVGRWLANSGSTQSIFTSLGIKP